jgi:hypothetical protein
MLKQKKTRPDWVEGGQAEVQERLLMSSGVPPRSIEDNGACFIVLHHNG